MSYPSTAPVGAPRQGQPGTGIVWGCLTSCSMGAATSSVSQSPPATKQAIAESSKKRIGVLICLGDQCKKNSVSKKELRGPAFPGSQIVGRHSVDGMRPVIDPHAPNPSSWDQLAAEISSGKLVANCDVVAICDKLATSHSSLPAGINRSLRPTNSLHPCFGIGVPYLSQGNSSLPFAIRCPAGCLITASSFWAFTDFCRFD